MDYRERTGTANPVAPAGKNIDWENYFRDTLIEIRRLLDEREAALRPDPVGK